MHMFNLFLASLFIIELITATETNGTSTAIQSSKTNKTLNNEDQNPKKVPVQNTTKSHIPVQPTLPSISFQSTPVENVTRSFRVVDYEVDTANSSLLTGDLLVEELETKIHTRKCCPVGESFIISLNRCHEFDNEFVVHGYNTRTSQYLNITSDQMIIESGLLTSCQPSVLSSDEFILLDSGSIFSFVLDEYFDSDHYCLEMMLDEPQPDSFQQITAAYCPNSHFPLTFDPNKIPVRKCCPQGEVVSSTTSECIFPSSAEDANWNVPLKDDEKLSTASANFTDYYEIVPGYPECVKEERGEILDDSWNFSLTHDEGLLSVSSLGIKTHAYCIDHGQNDGVENLFTYICLPKNEHEIFSQLKPSCDVKSRDLCITKCCPLNHVLNSNGACIPFANHSSLPYSVPVYFDNQTFANTSDLEFSVGFPNCNGRDLFITTNEERAHILGNNSLLFISYDPNECNPKIAQLIPVEDHCYDKIQFGTESDYGTLVPGALICYPMDQPVLGQHRQIIQVNYIYSIFLVISDVFILISFVIYLTVPDQTKRGLNKNVKLGHSILGRILLSFLFSLFFAYLCLIISKTASDPINLASNKACVTLGVTMYISFLATFFWLNVLCFELWWKCARQEGTSGRRWLWYQVYGWGSPIILGGAVLYIEFSPSIGPCFVKPNFGIYSCFFSETVSYGSLAKWVYLNGPVAVLLLADLLFFIFTVRSLLHTVQQSHRLTVKRQARQRLKLCFKLFLVMGICWLTEIISVATSTSKWYITEVFNCLQGFIIFLIFILKPKILQAVKQRLCACCCGKVTVQTSSRGHNPDSSIIEVSLRSRSDRPMLPKPNVFRS